MNYSALREWQKAQREAYFRRAALRPGKPVSMRRILDPDPKPGARNSWARKEAGKLALLNQHGRCAICAAPISYRIAEMDCSGVRQELPWASFIVHRIKPGRLGGEYEVNNVQVVCSEECHGKAEKETRKRYPI